MIRKETQRDYFERIRRVLEHIQRHLDDELDLAALARVASFSPHHFHRVFRGMTGESVAEHVRRLRLERAAQMLKGSRRPVTRLAFEAGYETHESFLRAFRARFGLLPSVYRRLHGNGAAETMAPSAATGEPTMEVKIAEMPRRRVAYVRHTGPYAECRGAWERICEWAGRKGLIGPDTQFVGVSYDDPEVTPPDKLRYDACVTVGDGVAGEGEVGIQEIGGGPYAVALHRGAYARLGETYAHVCGVWAPKSGREFRVEPCLEFYRNDCDTTPEDELVTEVCVPLEP